MAYAQATENRKIWISVLGKIITLKPEIATPAHANSNSLFDITAINHTKLTFNFMKQL